MHPLIIEKILFPFHERLFGRKTFVFLKELERSQWLDEKELAEYQLSKLKKLLCHCSQNVVYYRRLFAAGGFVPEKLNDLNQFSRLPVLDKKTIRENFNELKAQNFGNRLVKMSTGGSSGEPLMFWVDKNRVSYDKALRLRDRKWWGIGAGDREAVFWGSPVELSKQDRLKKIRDAFFNSRLLSAFDMTEDTMPRYAEEITAYKPRHIFGYPSSIYLFAQFAQRNKIDLASAGVKVIFTTGEMLYDFQREIIQKTFDCPLADEYGARDVGFIAQECPKGSLHISENILVETNNQGELILTNLDSYGMPFLRYRTGDIGEINYSQCACGRKLKVLKKIEGRRNDMLVTAGGKMVHPAVMNHIFRSIEGVGEFQVIQKAQDYLLTNIVRNAKFSASTEQIIRAKISEHIGAVRIQVNFVDKITPEKSGKFRYVISEVVSPI